MNFEKLNWLVFLLVLMLLSCKKEEISQRCRDLDLGYRYTSLEAKSYFPYEEIDRIIFLDSARNELALDVNKQKISNNIQGRFRCPGLDTFTAEYRFVEQRTRATFSTSDFKYNLSFEIVTSFENYYGGPQLPGEQEYLRVLMQRGAFSTQWLAIHYLNLLDNNNLNENYVEKIDLLGKEFEKVYYRKITHIDTREVFEAYLNKEFGLVAFTDNDGVFWRLERLE